MKEEFITNLTIITYDTNHVTSRGSLRWGNPQTGAEDASPVGQPRSVPQQHSISNVMEALVLALLVAAKDIQHFQGVHIVGLGVGRMQVPLNNLTWRNFWSSVNVTQFNARVNCIAPKICNQLYIVSS